MPSTFFGLTIAGSALNSFHVATNTIANNIANVNTKGYSRQEAVHFAAEALRTNQKYGAAGSGVTTTEIIQKRDFYYDVKYWTNNAKVGRYDGEAYYLEQIEDYLMDDDMAKGFATILDEMFQALEETQKTTEVSDARKAFISKSQSFANFFNSMSSGLLQIQEEINEEIAAQVETINGIGQKIALLNKQINIIELQNTNANELRDQRALLVDQLSELVSVEVIENDIPNKNYPDQYSGATSYTLKINGQTLVDTMEYRTLEYVPREKKINQSDAEGLYDIYWSGTTIPLSTTGSNHEGRLKALFAVRDGNNNQGFEGRITSITGGAKGDIVTISNPSITEVSAMTMPPEGVIMLNNTEYRYSGFSYDGETKTYQFQLVKPLSVETRDSLNGKKAAIGTNVDVMGIPYYQAQTNQFLREFAKRFNDLHKSGVDLDGLDGISFFVAQNPADGTEYDFSDENENGSMDVTSSTYYLLTGANVKVADAIIRDVNKLVTLTEEDLPDGVANQKLVNKMLALKSDVVMFRGGGADDFLQCLTNDNTVATEKAKLFLKNYTNISEAIETRRMSVSAVDEDEEGLDMLKFQNAYNLASRMIQTMTEMYDRLILETGV